MRGVEDRFGAGRCAGPARPGRPPRPRRPRRAATRAEGHSGPTLDLARAAAASVAEPPQGRAGCLAAFVLGGVWAHTCPGVGLGGRLTLRRHCGQDRRCRLMDPFLGDVW